VKETSSDLASRFLQGVGLADCPFGIAELRLRSYRRGQNGSPWRLAGKTNTAAEALEFLSTLSWPATRHVIFRNANGTTALLNNSRNGSDYADEVFHLPRHLSCRFARVVNQAGKVWRREKLRVVQSYSARIFSLSDARGETLRSVTCMDEGGRWVYHSAGTAHPVEATFGALVAKVSARFPPGQLAVLAAAYGLPLPTPSDFHRAGRYVLFSLESEYPVTTCTLAEADDPAYGYYLGGMGYVEHMATHASSVVSNFERCLEINPQYEPRVREYLREARSRLK
jgi:hypothetical protein